MVCLNNAAKGGIMLASDVFRRHEANRQARSTNLCVICLICENLWTQRIRESVAKKPAPSAPSLRPPRLNFSKTPRYY